MSFDPSSYGFRPGRRSQDAIKETRFLATRGYDRVFEGDIAACFDEIDHSALLGRLRRRVGNKKVMADPGQVLVGSRPIGADGRRR